VTFGSWPKRRPQRRRFLFRVNAQVNSMQGSTSIERSGRRTIAWSATVDG
jgi:hypothetical protein